MHHDIVINHKTKRFCPRRVYEKLTELVFDNDSAKHNVSYCAVALAKIGNLPTNITENVPEVAGRDG